MRHTIKAVCLRQFFLKLGLVKKANLAANGVGNTLFFITNDNYIIRGTIAPSQYHVCMI